MNHIDTVRKEARSFGLSLDLFDEAMSKTRIKEQFKFQFQYSKFSELAFYSAYYLIMEIVVSFL